MKHIFFLLFLVSSLAYGQQPARGTLMPVGAIMAFGGANCPDGWLAADGVAKATATYPQLDAYFGTTWGARSGGNFQIPNLNGAGRYLRGGDSVGTLQAQATAKNGLSNSASTVSGSVGGSDGAHGHTGATGRFTSGASNGAYNSIPGGSALGSITSWTDASIASTSSGHGHGFSLTAPAQTITGDTETRPITAVVKYCIKY